MWTYWLKKYEICGNIVKPILKDRMAPVVVVVVVVVMVQLMALERLLPFHFCLVYISTFELAKCWCVRKRRVCMRKTLPKHGSKLGVHFFSRRMICGTSGKKRWMIVNESFSLLPTCNPGGRSWAARQDSCDSQANTSSWKKSLTER